MRTHEAVHFWVAGAGILAFAAQATAAPLGSGFTYQGRLRHGGSAVNGAADLQFSLWDAASGGVQIGDAQMISAVPVSEGLFAVEINAGGEFGPAAFNGEARWLEIAVAHPSGSGSFVTLSPRQPITPGPYALRAMSGGSDGHSLDAVDGSPADAVFVDAQGKVGVGTTGPAWKLHVAGGVHDGVKVSVPDGANTSAQVVLSAGSEPQFGQGAIFQLNAPSTTPDPNALILLNRTNGPLVLGTNNQRMVDILPSGNVGIGTAEPAARLHVESPDGYAGFFRTTTPLALGSALVAEGSGSLGPTLMATNTGVGPAAWFRAETADNIAGAVLASTGGAGHALSASSTGAGYAVFGEMTGSGRAGEFENRNPFNLQPALGAFTDGSGPAVAARTVGGGYAGQFQVTNPANGSVAVLATTDGSGAAVHGKATGFALAADFRIENTENARTVVLANTVGLGRAGGFQIDNTASNEPALFAFSNGNGGALYARTTGTGRAATFVLSNAEGEGEAVYATTNTRYDAALRAVSTGGGPAAEFESNTASTIYAKNHGYGNAIKAVSEGRDEADPDFNATIQATNSGGGFVGSFVSLGDYERGGGVYIATAPERPGLVVLGGDKQAVVATSQGARSLYSEESSEVWFAEYGFGRLKDGQAVIAIDPLFAETVNLQLPYHVFVQPYGEASVHVASRTPTQFVVQARAGDSDVEFSYRLVAKRRGHEASRLNHAKFADSDPHLFPEKRAEWNAKRGLSAAQARPPRAGSDGRALDPETPVDRSVPAPEAAERK